MTREADKQAHQTMIVWGLSAIILMCVVVGTHSAPTWARIVGGLLAVLMAFFAGLVAIPDATTAKR